MSRHTTDTTTTTRPGDARSTVAVIVAAYGAVVAVANARNPGLGRDFTRRDEWLLFGGDSGFPADFGRNVFPGSVALGIALVALAVLVALLAGRSRAWIGGGVAGAVALLLVVTFRDDGNLLGAKPSVSAVLLAVAFYLGASALPVPDQEPAVTDTAEPSRR